MAKKTEKSSLLNSKDEITDFDTVTDKSKSTGKNADIPKDGSSTLKGLAAIFTFVILTSTSKICVQALNRSIPDFELNAARCGFALVAMTAYYTVNRTLPWIPVNNVTTVACFCVISTLINLGIYVTVTFIPLATSDCLMLTTTLLSGLGIFTFINKEGLKLEKLISVFLCCAGVLLVLQPEFLFSSHGYGFKGCTSVNSVSGAGGGGCDGNVHVDNYTLNNDVSNNRSDVITSYSTELLGSKDIEVTGGVFDSTNISSYGNDNYSNNNNNNNNNDSDEKNVRNTRSINDNNNITGSYTNHSSNNHDNNKRKASNNSATTTPLKHPTVRHVGTLSAILFGYTLAVLTGLLIALEISFIKYHRDFFTPDNLLRSLVWNYATGTVTSAVAMAIFETPLLPRKPTDYFLVGGHVFTFVFGVPLSLLASLNISGNLYTVARSTTLVIMLVTQYTILRHLHPGHRNWAEVGGVICVLVGTIFSSLVEIIKSRGKK